MGAKQKKFRIVLSKVMCKAVVFWSQGLWKQFELKGCDHFYQDAPAK